MTALAIQQPVSSDPNEYQRRASNPAASVWVNASAGSGKTKVLTERVIRLLLEGVRPEKILCLTYTRAGAAEMANRVTKVLSEWATCDDKILDDKLFDLLKDEESYRKRDSARRLFAKILSCPGGLRIRTIHSFCQEILSRFPLEAGLPPHFSLIDEQELTVLSDDVLNDMLRDASDNPDTDLALALKILVTAQGEFGFEKMLKEVMHAKTQLQQAAEQAGGAQKLIARMRLFLQLEPEESPESIRHAVIEKISESTLRQLAGWLALGGRRHKTRSDDILRFLALTKMQRLTRFDDYSGFFLTKDNQPYSEAFVASKEIRKQHPEIDDICAREAMLLQLALESIEAAEIAQTTEAVLTFGNLFVQRLASRKATRDVLDYDDLISFTEKLLHKPGIAPWILYKLDDGIDHILVDEAQDTSRAQWNIIQALTAEFYAGEGSKNSKVRTLLVVGDEKQSIFSFQNADPEGFVAWRTFFETRLKETGNVLEKIPMHTSFRSASIILKAVDAIFSQDSARAGVSPDRIKHQAFNRNKLGHVEVWPLVTHKDDKDSADGIWEMPLGYEEESDPQAELAQQIATKINSLLQGGTAQAEDIMILLRRRGRFADLMVRALKSAKIPVTGVDRMELIAQLPVMDLLAMLRFVLLPEDDLNLATLLRSPLLGLSEEQLMELAVGRTDSLWHSVKSSPEFTEAHDYLVRQLNGADFSTPFIFLSQILNAPCPGNRVSGRKALWARLGDESLDPLDELLNEAQNFAHHHSPSLQNFLHWLTKSNKDIKRELDHGNKQGGGQVRIMTVHASKGLEAPIVFLPDTVALPRAVDLPKFQWTKDGIPLFLTRRPDTQAAAFLWQAARSKQLEEYRRLFYVALTRAAERLYICGWQPKKGESDSGESWYNLAISALRPLHHDHLVTKYDVPVPEIVYADTPLSPGQAEREKPTSPPPAILPVWAIQPVAKSKSEIVRSKPPLPPATATPDAAFARGRIIHRLLQSLPDIAPEQRPAALSRFLNQSSLRLIQAQRDEIAHEVTHLLDDERFTKLFAPDSIAEVPLTGIIDGFAVFRQIDRLCLHGNEVWIVDYKTNRPPPQDPAEIPEAYRQQLREYKILLSGIYPDKKVRCFLLWTYAPRLMEIT